MRLEQLEYFLVISETKSMNKAASHLFVSPQTLCAALNSLENELGFSLFSRTAKGVQLSFEGELLYEEINDVVTKIHGWKFKKSPTAETVRIVYGDAFSPIIIDIIQKVKKTFPNTKICATAIDSYAFNNSNISKSNYSVVTNSLLNDSMLAALTIQKTQKNELFDKFEEDGWNINELTEDKVHIAVHRDNILSNRGYISKEELFNYELAVCKPTYLKHSAGFDLADYFENNISYTFSNKKTMHELVARNIAVCPATYLDTYNNSFFEQGILKLCAIENYDSECIHLLLYPKGSSLSPINKFIVNEIFSVFEQMNNERLI